MYDAKKEQEKKEKCLKYDCIADRFYYEKSQRSQMVNFKTSGIPTENIFY